MTPEELAVIQAAMEWRYAVLANPEALRPLHNANNALTPVLSELSRTTYQLAISCPECNAGGHTCPGDGEHIPHGATNCGDHDETHPANELIWVERTWADVRTGDMVSLGQGQPSALVHSAVHLQWHVHPQTGTASWNPPQAHEWSAVRVVLTPEDQPGVTRGPYDMDPAKPILIQIQRETAEAAALLHGGPDWWSERAGVITDAA